MSFKFTNKKDQDWGVVCYYYPTSEPFHFVMYFYDDDPETAYLCNVFVNEDHRGENLGNRILSMAQTKALEMGCKEIRLKVDDDNDFAHNWYKRHGFEDMYHDKSETTRMWMKKVLTAPRLMTETKITLSIKQLKNLISDIKHEHELDSEAFDRVFEIFDRVVVNIDYLGFLLKWLSKDVKVRCKTRLSNIKNEQEKLTATISDAYTNLGFYQDVPTVSIIGMRNPNINQIKQDVMALIDLTKSGIFNARMKTEQVLDGLNISTERRQELLGMAVDIYSSLQNQLLKVEDSISQLVTDLV